MGKEGRIRSDFFGCPQLSPRPAARFDIRLSFDIRSRKTLINFHVMNRGFAKIVVKFRQRWKWFWTPVELKYGGTPAFKAGWLASETCVARKKNPHRIGSVEREAWFEGWDEQSKYETSLW